MVRLSGKPLLEWRIDTLPEDIDEVILIVGYLQEQIRSYFGDEWQGRSVNVMNSKKCSMVLAGL